METMGCVGLKEAAGAAVEGAGGEEEVELELGLSIGGRSYASKRSEKVFELHQICKAVNDDPTTAMTVSPSREVVLEPIITMTKREMHAWRRREAKKKREEKLMVKKRLCSSSSSSSSRLPRNGDYDYCGSTLWANGQNGFHNEGREEKEEEQAEEEEEELKCKKCKTAGEDAGSGDLKNNYVNLNSSIDQQENMDRPQMELQSGYPGNGFVFPRGNVNVIPCWLAGGSPAPGAPPVGLEGNNVIQQPMVSYGFRPFQLGSEAGSNGLDSEKTKKKNVRSRTEDRSNGSSACTSSAGSDHMRFSREGSGSSESRSYSTHSELKAKKSERNASKSTDVKSESEHSATSHLMESSAFNAAANHVDKAVPLTSVQCSTTEPKPKEEACKSRTEPLLAGKYVSPPNIPRSGSLKQNTGRPPKPKTQNQDSPASLPCMPWVSTTGNGPNGKTINGFLYRYTRTEVSIICVCHGTSFSPAEFVQHAGGTDVSNPLRHITVIPSAF